MRAHRFVLWLSVATLSAVGPACGESPAGPGAAMITFVTITGPASLAPGQSAQYSVVVTLADGSSRPATSVSWTAQTPPCCR